MKAANISKQTRNVSSSEGRTKATRRQPASGAPELAVRTKSRGDWPASAPKKPVADAGERREYLALLNAVTAGNEVSKKTFHAFNDWLLALEAKGEPVEPVGLDNDAMAAMARQLSALNPELHPRARVWRRAAHAYLAGASRVFRLAQTLKSSALGAQGTQPAVGKRPAANKPVDVRQARQQQLSRDLLAALKPRLDVQGYSLAQRCIDEMLASRSQAVLEQLNIVDMADAMQRSIDSVLGKKYPTHLESLAFRLTFELDFMNKLDKISAAPTSHAWDDVFTGRYTQQQRLILLTPMHMGCDMARPLLTSGQPIGTVEALAQPVFNGLVKRIFPERLKSDKDVQPYSQMALALRNVALACADKYGNDTPDALVQTLAGQAKKLLKAKGEREAVSWTMSLLERLHAAPGQGHAPRRA